MRCVLTIFLLITSTALWSRETGEKKIHHDIEVNSNALFEVHNYYGDLIVTTEPNRKDISVDITIKLSERNEQRVQAYLDKITIELDQSPDHVQLKTIIDKKGCSFNDLEIDYIIHMPQQVRVDLNNRYGNIVINQLHRASEIELHYGNMKIDELRDTDNNIKLMYADLKLNSAKSIDIHARYSDVSIDTADKMKGDFMYTDSKIENCEDFQLKTRYGDLHLERSRVVLVDAMYSDIELENVAEDLKITTRYGDLEVSNISKDFQGVEVDGMYSEIELSFESGSAFILSGDLSYAEMSLPSDAEIIKKDKSGAQYALQAQKGTSKTVNKRVEVNSQYGDVKIR
jgi:hypothetical protein